MSGVIHRFLAAEYGAVTVDWVVLTAIATAFGVIVTTTLGAGTDDVATNMENNLTGLEVAPLQQLGYSQ